MACAAYFDFETSDGPTGVTASGFVGVTLIQKRVCSRYSDGSLSPPPSSVAKNVTSVSSRFGTANVIVPDAVASRTFEIVSSCVVGSVTPLLPSVEETPAQTTLKEPFVRS